MQKTRIASMLSMLPSTHAAAAAVAAAAAAANQVCIRQEFLCAACLPLLTLLLALLLLLLLPQVKYAEDQDFFYAQYTSLYSNLANLGYKNNEIVTVTGTNRRRRANTAGH
jgi:hypothetical protein